ncbi:MAG: hypothetical protein ACLTZU_10235 [Odoribacter splanchnicus]
MTNEKQQNRKTFIDCYRIGRSLEYMDRYDQEQAWKKLNSAIQRKRLHRRISYMSSVAAMVAIAFTSFYLWRGEDQAPAEVPMLRETVDRVGVPEPVMSDGRGSIFLPRSIRQRRGGESSGKQKLMPDQAGRLSRRTGRVPRS